MCGIVGTINAAVTAHRPTVDFMAQGIVTSQLRGTDSTGVFQIGLTKAAVWMHKDAVNASDFVEQPGAMAIISDSDRSLITVAHVRARTQGAVNADNAHPFAVSRDDGNRVIGVHNGSLTSWAQRADAKGFNVDSHWAISRIAEKGLAAFEDIHGPYAFVWWDEADRTKVNIARNISRPMHIMFSRDMGRMIFASEAGMLAWIAQRTNFPTDGKVREIPTGQVWTFDTSGSKITWTKAATPSPKYQYQGTAYSHTPANTRASSTVPIPPAYGALAAELRNVLAGKGTGKDVKLSYSRSAYTSGTTYMGNDMYPWSDEDWGDDLAALLDDVSTPLPEVGEFRMPESVMPAASVHLADPQEVGNAQLTGLYGAVVHWTADCYVPGTSTLMGMTNGDNRDRAVDVVMRGVGKTEGSRASAESATMTGVIVGMEMDETLIVTRLTRRMKKMLSS